MLYQLEDMSFREYLELIHNIKLPVYKFEQIIKEHSKITADLLKEFKPFLHNTNLMFALSQRKPDQGNLRETFFFNQVSAKQTVTHPSKADFLVNEKYLFEVGGKNKTQKQISGSKHAYIAKDDIEYGYDNVIPLWLFGLMY